MCVCVCVCVCVFQSPTYFTEGRASLPQEAIGPLGPKSKLIAPYSLDHPMYLFVQMICMTLFKCYDGVSLIVKEFKVRKVAKIRNQYNQVPHLTQKTTWKGYKNTIKHNKQEPSSHPFWLYALKDCTYFTYFYLFLLSIR